MSIMRTRACSSPSPMPYIDGASARKARQINPPPVGITSTTAEAVAVLTAPIMAR